MDKLVILVIGLAIAIVIWKLRGDAAKERKAVMARLAAERDERGDYSPTAELFREVGVHHQTGATLPYSFEPVSSGASLAAPPPPTVDGAPVDVDPVDPGFEARTPGFARGAVVSNESAPAPAAAPEPDLRTLFKGISMPAGLRPLGPLVPVTASFVTEASPAEVHAGLEAEFERLDCAARWVEPTVAQTERNGVRGLVTIYPNPAALTDLDGAPLFPDVAPGHVVVKMLAL